MSFYIKQCSPFILASGEKNKLTDAALQERLFSEPLGLEWFSEGFIPPVSLSGQDSLLFKVQNIIQAAIQKEEKVLPAGVINDFVNDKVQLIEAEEARSVGRKEKQQIKEQMTDDLLPKAFTKKSIRRGYFTDRLLFVDKASASQAEAFLTTVRQTVGGIDVRLVRTERSLSSVMTNWLTQKQAEGNFVLDSDCELKGVGEAASVVRMSKQDLTSDEVDAHLQNKLVTRLGLIWADKIRFILSNDFTFTRIQYLDILQEEVSDQGEDKESLLVVTQLICVRELEAMLFELLEHCGGLECGSL